jgi:hypothetical protein
MRGNILIFLMAVVFTLSACGAEPKMGSRTSNFFFKPASLQSDPPDGPPEYQQGWIDGCESGMAAYTNPLVKSFKAYKLKQDPNLRNNKMYYQVWKDAYLYCAIAIESVNNWNI